MVKKYSAGSVKYLFWFVETKETVRLCQDHTMAEVRDIVIKDNVYQQRAQSRMISEFGCIRRRIEETPKDVMNLILTADVSTAKIIALISAMESDRMLFELVYELYGDKLRLGEDEITDADMNIFFDRKMDQDIAVAAWTEVTVKKLKSTYIKFMIEAGILKKESGSNKIAKPYIDDELRQALKANEMIQFIYAFTGER